MTEEDDMRSPDTGGIRPAIRPETDHCDACTKLIVLQQRDTYTVRPRDGKVSIFCMRCWEEMRTPYNTMHREKLPTEFRRKLKEELAATIARERRRSFWGSVVQGIINAFAVFAVAGAVVAVFVLIARLMGWL
jgi:RNase P subunit RPR2